MNLEGIIIMEIEEINIPLISLKWQRWYSWDDLKVNALQSGIHIPESKGVYEVRKDNDDKRLTIGRATVLRDRIKKNLLRGVSHSEGERIIATEKDTSRLFVRWAETNRPCAVEEELHRRYLERFGELPLYAKQTC